MRKPGKTASFKEYMEYYLKRKKWSQNRLAICARLNQSQINKIINGTVYTVQVDILVCICLALQLSLAESKALMARAERAFSPAVPLHTAYQELIQLYSEKETEYGVNSNMLIEADEYLKARRLPTLPDVNGY